MRHPRARRVPGLPGKNIRLLGGHPLVAWTIQAALEAEEDLHVVVSTDSAETAEVALRYGADVPGLRPAHLAQDSTPTEPVIEHVLAAERAAGVEPEGVMLLQATSPLRLPGTLDRAVRQFRQTGWTRWSASSRCPRSCGATPRTPRGSRSRLRRHGAQAPAGHVARRPAVPRERVPT